MNKLDELIEEALVATQKAFTATCAAERLIYAVPLTTLKVPIISTHSALLAARNELRWIQKERRNSQ